MRPKGKVCKNSNLFELNRPILNDLKKQQHKRKSKNYENCQGKSKQKNN